MNPLSAPAERDASADFIAGVCELLALTFPQQIKSIYLIGSRASGKAIASSDVDLCLVFDGATAAHHAPALRKFLAALRRTSPTMIDATITDEADVARGITPHLAGGQLLAGPDVLAGARLKPRADLLLIHAAQAIHFIRVARSQPRLLTYPLQFPDTHGEFLGYEANGLRIAEGVYALGFNVFVNLITTIANFRLGLQTDVFAPDKATTVELCRQLLPDDPWTPLVEDVFRICRLQWPGAIPTSGPDRTRLAECCHRALAFENELIALALQHAADWASVENPILRRQVAEFVRSVTAVAPVDAARLAALQTLFPLKSAPGP